MKKATVKIPVLAEARVTYVPKVKPSMRPKITNSADVAKLVLDGWDDVWHHEKFKVLLLNTQNQVLGVAVIGDGGIAFCNVDIKLALQRAIAGNATAMIAVHNHPSGNAAPSENDNKLTRRLDSACKACDLKLLDHVIVTGDGGYYSFADSTSLLD